MKKIIDNHNAIASFSPLRRGVLLVLYFIVAAFVTGLLYSLCSPENIYLNLLMMLLSGEKGIIESAVIVLLLFTFPAFFMLLYNSIPLFILCLSIDGNRCFIKADGSFIRYSFPDISSGFSLQYNSGYAELAPGSVKRISVNESWSRFHLVPVREIIIEFNDKRSVVRDSIFFEEHLADIKEQLEFAAFPETAPEPGEKLEYREGESIIDEDGIFIPPGA